MSLTLPLLAAVAVLGLFGIGLLGLLVTRNLIKVVVGLQVVVKSAMLALVLAGRLAGQIQLGQSMALTVIVADTIVSVVALALAVTLAPSSRAPSALTRLPAEGGGEIVLSGENVSGHAILRNLTRVNFPLLIVFCLFNPCYDFSLERIALFEQLGDTFRISAFNVAQSLQISGLCTRMRLRYPSA